MTCLNHDGDGQALSYDRLEQPWFEWAKIARNFSYQLENEWDREDLLHDIIVRLAELAEEYRRRGKPLTKWGCIRAAQYERLQFYHKKKRWKRVFSVSLNSTIQDEEGYETEMVNVLLDQREFDLDSWLDAKGHYLGSPNRIRRAVRNLVYKDWRSLSGYDWKLIRRFRTEFKAKTGLA